ncbi:glycosyltransferase family 25 protein [Rouxiella sp. T17]|uniref:glycosyltransferase family 25 protein n=1 Tax=Rouxiella sp. T17 TaxID=3085684 RepID=UPI002FC66AD6
MKTYVISLENDFDKRAVLLSQCKELGLEVELFYAIEGAALELSYINRNVDNYPDCRMTLGVIGCALSHLAIYKKMIDGNLPMALILEDDARISTRTLEVLKELETTYNNNERVYLLTPPEHYCPTKSISVSPHLSFYRVSTACSTAGYVVTLQAAKKLININMPIKWEADSWAMFSFVHDLEIYCLVPPVIADGDIDKRASTLEVERAKMRLKEPKFVIN